MDKTSVIIVDDHPLLREGITHILEKEADLEVVGQAADGEEAVKLAAEKSPDVVLMDIEMPKLDGLEATKQIKATHPEVSVLVLTVHDEEEFVAAMLDAGAAGYLLKTTPREKLVQAIRSIRVGEYILDTQIGKKVLRDFAICSGKYTEFEAQETLSPREIEVARWVGRGLTNEEIAAELGISLRMVKSYLSDIFDKLGVSSRTEVIVACMRAGVISLNDLH